MQLTVGELKKKLNGFHDDIIVVIHKENDENEYSGALSIKSLTLDYEHSDASIEEECCVCISDE